MATVFRQSAGAGEPPVCALGDGGVKPLERSASVSGSRHHRVVAPVLHDSPVGRVLWSCRTLAMASLGAWQCDRRVSGVATVTAPSTVVAASASRRDASGRPGVC